MVAKLVSVCLFDDLPEGRARRVKAPDGRALACVRRGRTVDVLDDRCPHEGHPLSLGAVRDGVITCAWHNWKFSLESGDCVQGEEGTLRFPVEIHHGEVFVDLTPPASPRVERAAADLRRSLGRGSLGGALRSALRLDALTGSSDRALGELLGYTLARDPAGDVLVTAHAARDLARDAVIDAAEAHALVASAVIAACAGRGPRSLPPAVPGALDDVEAFLLALLDERGEVAAGMVRGLPPAVDAAAIARTWLLPFASLKLWDLGAALPRVAALVALAPSLDAALARGLAASLAGSFAAAFAPSELPAWGATRRAMLRARTISRGAGAPFDPAALTRAVLVSEGEATHAAIAALARGVAPAAVLDALAAAAALRLAGFTPTPRGRGLVRDPLEAGQALTFLDAARSLDDGASPWAVAHAVLAAGFVGKLRRHDVPAPAPSAAGDLAGLRAALARRDAAGARASLGGGEEGLREVVRFGALSARGESAGAAALAAALWRTRRGSDPATLARAGLRTLLECPAPDLAEAARAAARAAR